MGLSREVKIYNAVMAIYKEMYAKATPPADLNLIIESGEGKVNEFYNKYYLSPEDILKILDDWESKSKLSKYDKKTVRASVLLGAAPCSSKDTVNSYRTKLGLKPI